MLGYNAITTLRRNTSERNTWQGRRLTSPDKLRSPPKKFASLFFLDSIAPLQNSFSQMLLEALRERQTEQMVKLIGYGASINGPQGDHDETLPLHTAILNDFLVGILYMLENGADVGLQDKKGWTALHYAAFLNNADLCRLLIKYGASPTQLKFVFRLFFFFFSLFFSIVNNNSFPSNPAATP